MRKDTLYSLCFFPLLAVRCITCVYVIVFFFFFFFARVTMWLFVVVFLPQKKKKSGRQSASVVLRLGIFFFFFLLSITFGSLITLGYGHSFFFFSVYGKCGARTCKIALYL